jgi:hypothetical protein
VKNGLTGLLIEELLKLTDVFFMMLRGMRGGSIAVTSGGVGSQYDVENGSMDLLLGSISWSRLASDSGVRK